MWQKYETDNKNSTVSEHYETFAPQLVGLRNPSVDANQTTLIYLIINTKTFQ